MNIRILFPFHMIKIVKEPSAFDAVLITMKFRFGLEKTKMKLQEERFVAPEIHGV